LKHYSLNLFLRWQKDSVVVCLSYRIFCLLAVASRNESSIS
jgi:hypothetical protein